MYMMWFLYPCEHVCVCAPQKWAVTEGTSPRATFRPSLTPGRAGPLLLLPASGVPLVVLPQTQGTGGVNSQSTGSQAGWVGRVWSLERVTVSGGVSGEDTEPLG